MKTAFLLAILVALSFSGCFGYPEGSVRPGDTVTIRFDATDPATGNTVAVARQTTFVVGSGTSGLGQEVERALVGHKVNDTVEVSSRDDPSRSYSQEVEINRTLDEWDVVANLSRSDFEANIGEPTVGQEFPLNVYEARVESFDEQAVTYRFLIDGEQRDDFPTVGVTLVSSIRGDDLVRRLDPMVGTTFPIHPPSYAVPSTPLGLEPGSYKTLGADDDSIIFGYSPSRDATLLVEDLDVVMTIVSHQPVGHESEPVDGNYGVRDGSQVLGDRRPTVSDDGHDH